MATVSLDLFLPEIAPSVLGCPEPLIKSKLRDTLSEFCTRTSCWRERLPAVSLSSGDFPYSVTPPAHGELVRVQWAHMGATRLEPTTYDILDASSDWDTQLGVPTHFVVDHDGSIVVYPLPSSAMDFRATVVYTVTSDATVVEDFLFDRWKVELAHGTLRKLAAMPDKAWSKPDMVAYYTTKFEQKVQDVRAEMNMGNRTLGNLSVAMRPLA